MLKERVNRLSGERVKIGLDIVYTETRSKMAKDEIFIELIEGKTGEVLETHHVEEISDAKEAADL